MLREDPMQHTKDEHDAIQTYRITVRSRRSNTACAPVQVCDGRITEEGFMTEACYRLNVPVPSAKHPLRVARSLAQAVERGDLPMEELRACPLPGCGKANHLDDPAHIHRCGTRAEGNAKSMRGKISNAVERVLAQIISESTGVHRNMKPQGLFVSSSQMTGDAIYANSRGLEVVCDCVCVYPHCSTWRRHILGITPGLRRGSDWYDHAALDCASCLKRRQYGVPFDQLCLEGGRLPLGTSRSLDGRKESSRNKVKKELKDKRHYVIRDFNILNTGRLGISARRVLADLAHIKRKRLGKRRSKSVDAQVKIWARRFALTMANVRAEHLNTYYSQVHIAAERRLGDALPTEDADAREGADGAQAEAEPAHDADGVEAATAATGSPDEAAAADPGHH